MIISKYLKHLAMLIFVYTAFVPDDIVKSLIPRYFIDHNIVFIGMFVIIVCYYVLNTKKQSTIIILLIMYCFYVLGDTFFNGGNIVHVMLIYGRVIATCLLIDTLLRKRDYDMLIGFTNGLNLIVILNLISIFESVNLRLSTSLGDRYFLGFDNGICVVLFPTVVFNLLVNVINRQKLFSFRTVLVLFVTGANVILIGSSTTIVGWILFLLVCSFKKIDLLKIAQKKNLIIIVIAIFVSIVLLRLQEVFSVFIVNWLGKDLTFTGRILLWDKAIHGFGERPFFGHGVDPNARKTLFQGLPAAHNFLLDSLYDTGLIGTAFVVIIVAYCLNLRVNNTAKSIRIFSDGLDTMLFSIMVMMMFESYTVYQPFALIVSLFVVSTHISDIAKWQQQGTTVSL